MKSISSRSDKSTLGNGDSTSYESEASCELRLTTVKEGDDSGIPVCLSKVMPRIYRATLRPLDLSFGHVREKEAVIDLHRASRHVVRKSVVSKTQKAVASVCFVVRRPGCVLCFEQGAALSELISEFAENQVGAWAVVKEINVDNEGLLNLYQNHFKFPFFRDERLALYAALGQRRIPLFTNVFKFGALRQRCKDKGIEGRFSGKDQVWS